jgi:hypothetical protein
MQSQCSAHAAISGIAPGLGVDGGGKAEGANRGGSVGNAKEISSARRQLHAADGASMGLEEVVAGVGESESEEEEEEERKGNGHCWGNSGERVEGHVLGT